MGNASCILSHQNVMSYGVDTSHESAESQEIPCTSRENAKEGKNISMKEFSKLHAIYSVVPHKDTRVKMKL